MGPTDNGNGLGCSATCTVSPGWACTNVNGQVSTCSKCGNGFIETGEQCDLGNSGSPTFGFNGVAHSGCNSTCNSSAGFTCDTTVGDAGECHNCGDGYFQPGGVEECDLGGQNGAAN